MSGEEFDKTCGALVKSSDQEKDSILAGLADNFNDDDEPWWPESPEEQKVAKESFEQLSELDKAEAIKKAQFGAMSFFAGFYQYIRT